MAKPAELAREQELEIVTQSIEETKKKWVRIGLVQLDFSLVANRPPKEFGYSLQNEPLIKKKVFKALNIAEKKSVDILCFPELSVVEEWVKEVKDRFKNTIVVFGSYYKDAFNICPILIKGQDYYVRKINPSPHFEKEVIEGRYMKKGNQIFAFHTHCGKFVVLICYDCREEVHRILHNRDENVRNTDFIIVPEYNRDIKAFQEHGNHICQQDNFPYVLQINALKVFGREIGGTCVIGMEHKSALERYKLEGLKSDDNIEYKLVDKVIDENGEVLVILDLDIGRKGAPIPASDPKMKFVGTFSLD